MNKKQYKKFNIELHWAKQLVLMKISMFIKISGYKYPYLLKTQDKQKIAFGKKDHSQLFF